jgi:hypothetical protein
MERERFYQFLGSLNNAVLPYIFEQALQVFEGAAEMHEDELKKSVEILQAAFSGGAETSS